MPATQKTAATQIAALRLDLPDPLPVALTVKQGTRIAGVSESTFWDAIRDGSVKSVKLRGRVLIPTLPFLRRFGIEPSPVVFETTAD